MNAIETILAIDKIAADALVDVVEICRKHKDISPSLAIELIACIGGAFDKRKKLIDNCEQVKERVDK